MKSTFVLAVALALLPTYRGLTQAIPPVEAPPQTSLTGAPPQQTISHDVTPSLTEAEISAISQFQTATISRIFGLKVQLEGAIPRAVRASNPLHLINPLAPAEYGTGWDNVTTNPETGRANGIVIFGIRF